mmetsp:Transcript_72373/g.132466  ORF Transcript_72373/g.132466 Transcript_72373/m.132466 type:complete len:272 (+) Transcript_72373:50-865(+)
MMAFLPLLALFCFCGFAAGAQLRNGTTAQLRGGAITSASDMLAKSHAQALANSTQRREAPCSCVANDAAWAPCQRTVPKCIFVDLGAADGNSFQHFLNNGYGPVANCPSGQWEALLVEANPQFTPALNTLSTQYAGSVHSLGSTAAYSCQGQTSFSIDPDVKHNHWGSSMKRSFGTKTVIVPTVNVMQLLTENVIQGDWVILKVDIEGAEYDLLPCLAHFQKLSLLDAAYIEEHKYLQKNSVYTPQQYDWAKATLKHQGIQVPDNYHSKTF